MPSGPLLTGALGVLHVVDWVKQLNGDLQNMTFLNIHSGLNKQEEP